MQIIQQFKQLPHHYFLTPYRMKASNYQCVNCQITFPVESAYIEHYKSEHHRYNIKRKIIGLPPLSFEEYHLQFQDDKSSRNSIAQDFHCEICSKKFTNSSTYSQHLSSTKHKQARLSLKSSPKSLSKSSSSSSFQILGTSKPEPCLFCAQECTKVHMRERHAFPPFEGECVDYEGLVEMLRGKIGGFCCVYCGGKFGSVDGVKQHMEDVGHAKLDIENFDEYEKFYLWKISQSSEQSQQQAQSVSPPKSLDSQPPQILHNPTLHQLQQQRLSRITYTATGAIINGKEVGYRHLKQYYKQYLNREVIDMHPSKPAIEQAWNYGPVGGEKVARVKQIVNGR